MYEATARLTVTALLTVAPMARCAPEKPAAAATAAERTRVPDLQPKLDRARKWEQKEEYAKALEAYTLLLRSALAVPEERWLWYQRTGWLSLLALRPLQAEQVFFDVLHPETAGSWREITIITGGKKRMVRVRDPLRPGPPKETWTALQKRHDQYQATLGLARALAEQRRYQQAAALLERADLTHPLQCPLCGATARVTQAGMQQAYEAAAAGSENPDVAYNRLHDLIDGRCWLPLNPGMKEPAAQRLVAREARLVLAEKLLAANDAAKAKTFFQLAAAGQSVTAKLARAHLRRLTGVTARPSERPDRPATILPPPLPTPPPPTGPPADAPGF